MGDRVYSTLLIVGLMTAAGPSCAESVAGLFGGADFRFGEPQAAYLQPKIFAGLPVGGPTAVVTPVITANSITGVVVQFNPGRFETVKKYVKARYAKEHCARTRVYENPNDVNTELTNEVCIFTADDGLVVLSRANPVFLQKGMPATRFNPDISALLAVRKEDAETALRMIPHNGSKDTPSVAGPAEPIGGRGDLAAPDSPSEKEVKAPAVAGGKSWSGLSTAEKTAVAKVVAAKMKDSDSGKNAKIKQAQAPIAKVNYAQIIDPKAIERYHATADLAVKGCWGLIAIALDMAKLGAPAQGVDYAKCISDQEIEVRNSFKTAISTVKKGSAQEEALKNYQVAVISALEGIAPGIDEPTLTYQQRQQTLSGKMIEAWTRFEIEQ